MDKQPSHKNREEVYSPNVWKEEKGMTYMNAYMNTCMNVMNTYMNTYMSTHELAH
jgi:hypothetical protein